MFTDLYLKTTDPKLTWTDFFSREIMTGIILSTIFHTILYASAFNLASYIFYGKILTNAVNMRLLISLLLIMFFGFLGRFLHVKEVYKAYGGNMRLTREHLDKLYIGWIFIS